MIIVIYKIFEKNTSIYTEKDICMGIFPEDTKLEDVFMEW
jgi:hypothetical protein